MVCTGREERLTGRIIWVEIRAESTGTFTGAHSLKSREVCQKGGKDLSISPKGVLYCRDMEESSLTFLSNA